MKQDKFVPYEKLSKKSKRAMDAQKRGTWGTLSPVTRVAENGRHYSRKVKHKHAADTFFHTF